MNNTYVSAPEIGQIVNLRERPFVVLNVNQSTLPSLLVGDRLRKSQHLVSLSSIEDDSLGEELEVIWEIEPGAFVRDDVSLPEPAAGFDDPALLDAFLDAVNWGASSTADIRSLQSPFRSGIEIEDYQLDPLVRAIRMPRVNLLIADDVGLGKTIESGLVAQELIIRHRVRTVLVVCPASLQVQWRDQMRDKFGLEFRIVDRELIRYLRRKRGLHVNPWNHFPRLITSIDYLKQERTLRQFMEILPAAGEAIYPRRFDMLIVDEAHNVAPSGRNQYAIDSKRTKTIRQLVPHFEHKLFLTATPHNGYPESFSALLELLDNQRFARGIAPDHKQLAPIMVRRLKSELPPLWDGTPRFPKRELVPIEVEYSREEKDIHRILHQYTRSRLKHVSSREESFATEFVLKLLKKRLFSSVAAFQSTLRKHEESLKNAQRKRSQAISKPSIGILQKMVERIEEDYADDDLYDESETDAVDATTKLFSDLRPEEKQYLKQMREWADDAVRRPDCKTQELIRELLKILKPNGKWSNERVIIFTEFRDTQKWLHTMLAAEGLTHGERLETMYGGMDTEKREQVKAAFQASPAQSSVRILLATDSASEGIDLQNYCNKLIHFEIPWNPNRMEQRNGRIDRHGQRANQVLIHHFVCKGYQSQAGMVDLNVGELEADLEFLKRVAIKVDQIRTDLGKVGPVIAQQVEEAMLGNRSRLETESAEETAKKVAQVLKQERNLREQIQRFMDQMEETKRAFRYSPENIRHIVDIGLQLAGQPPLIEAKLDGIWPDPAGVRKHCPVFSLPQFSGSWSLCSHGLAHPHSGEIRPITFDHSIIAKRDDVVLCHLNHRLVQMCLRLLRAEIWSTNKKHLHRVTARLVPDHVLSTPAVIAHARLVIIGDDNHRLHEEIIMAGGILKEGRFSRLNVGDTRNAVLSALPQAASSSFKQKFAEIWPKHKDSLISALEARMKERLDGLTKQLQDRSEKEIADITSNLTELKNSIQHELDELDSDVQLTLFDLTEKDQFKQDIENLRYRLQQIPGEIERESELIRKRFSNPSPRMFPIAVTFLVPKKMNA
ncbi:MAG: helicase [Candidatus Omnitrophota bacterium]|jgi:SNF2 family DNA or RNA helicase|nr:MAG: helicase [Candidatus Omnitrophota bacterium]